MVAVLRQRVGNVREVARAEQPEEPALHLVSFLVFLI